MAELQADLRLGELVHEAGDAGPCLALFGIPDAGACGRDARVGRRAGHLGHDECSPPDGATAQVHLVPVVRHAVDSAVLRHRRHTDPVVKAHVSQREGVEDRGRVGSEWPGVGWLVCREPAQGVVVVLGVALAQVVVGDSLGSREQREHELLEGALAVVINVAEPVLAGRRSPLQALDLGPAVGFEVLEGSGHVGAGRRRPRHGISERDGIFERHLGAAAHRIVSRVGRIAQQHHVVHHPRVA